MTIAEVNRAIESKKRMQKINAQEKATFDYILANVIARGFARVQSSENRMPSLEEVYSSLFSGEEETAKRQEQKDKLSALRFKQFAQSFNNKYKGVKSD